MSNPNKTYVVNQPRNEEIHNSFDLMGNERYLRTWKFTEKSCGCTDAHYITLTDARLLLRSEDTTCCNCCCDSNHSDSSIFLRDVAEMRETTASHDCCYLFCTRCCPCCSCCCNGPKHIEIRGSFGAKTLHIDKADVDKVQVEIPAAIGNHKLVSQY